MVAVSAAMADCSCDFPIVICTISMGALLTPSTVPGQSSLIFRSFSRQWFDLAALYLGPYAGSNADDHTLRLITFCKAP
jgi:hypothetical protein